MALGVVGMRRFENFFLLKRTTLFLLNVSHALSVVGMGRNSRMFAE